MNKVYINIIKYLFFFIFLISILFFFFKNNIILFKNNNFQKKIFFMQKNKINFFENNKIYNIGETIKVIIKEKIIAVHNSNEETKNNKNKKIDILGDFPNYFNIKKNKNYDFLNIYNKKNEEISNEKNSKIKNIFLNIISVTIKKILSNGNLIIEGEKNIKINNITENIYISGIINPKMIDINNTIKSYNISNIIIKYNSICTNKYNNINWLKNLLMYILYI
ncbi:flagellar basal body L-ring protein FlgH [Buchnera aphidicola]|uniref:flagellar basal body L-ring protein FlgH n=1 Tax=Buchnera aphidicola TaxID=9 RepID=UPI0031B800DF